MTLTLRACEKGQQEPRISTQPHWPPSPPPTPRDAGPVTQGQTLTVPVYWLLPGFGMHQCEGQLHCNVTARDTRVKHGPACTLHAE